MLAQRILCEVCTREVFIKPAMSLVVRGGALRARLLHGGHVQWSKRSNNTSDSEKTIKSFAVKVAAECPRVFSRLHKPTLKCPKGIGPRGYDHDHIAVLSLFDIILDRHPQNAVCFGLWACGTSTRLALCIRAQDRQTVWQTASQHEMCVPSCSVWPKPLRKRDTHKINFTQKKRVPQPHS